MWQVVNLQKRHQPLRVTRKAVWFMEHRIRAAIGMATPDKLTGHVESDETFVGGKARNMHKDVRSRKFTDTESKDKTMVMGILERGKNGSSSQMRGMLPITVQSLLPTFVPLRSKQSQRLTRFFSHALRIV